MPYRKKLIEVALPLEAINKASVRENYIYRGNPSSLHKWWAQRPLAAARAVIFAQMVDDPSANPDLFPTEKAQEKERQRLFRIIEDLVLWENTTNEEVLERARAEIWQSWRRACAENADHPQAKELFDRHKLPAFHDPFAGGGTLPLEAQRLGLEAHASDLNPVAVLITKALIEIPPKFAGRPPVNPEARKNKALIEREWRGAQGLAEDVRYYGKWMREEAEKRIGHLYPKIEITADIAEGRPDLEPLVGKKYTVNAWLWARTVKSPNPAFANVDVPLASTFMLSTKVGKEAYVEPVIENGGYRFTVRVGNPKRIDEVRRGTRAVGSGFLCVMSGTPMPFDYIRAEAIAGRMSARLMAIVAAGERGRVYLVPIREHEAVAMQAKPKWKPEIEFFQQALGFRVGGYGMTKWSDLFTSRQLLTLTTISDLTQDAQERICQDIKSMNVSANDLGAVNANAYANAVAVYLAFCVDKYSMYGNSLVPWYSKEDRPSMLFGQQVVSMVWDYAEVNPLTSVGGSIERSLGITVSALEGLPLRAPQGRVAQKSAEKTEGECTSVISTDPPYYDNVGYADLSDFFYIWLRRSLKSAFPELFGTVSTPKAEELVATPGRHGGKKKAEHFFLEGMTLVMNRLAEASHPVFPVTIYYAFRQSESGRDGRTTSTGWETFLDAVIRAGFALSGTWPMRTERTGRLRDSGSNALASSIVLVCRPRAASAATVSRRDFHAALKAELPLALKHLQRGNIAPVDLAQAAIGPGMAVYTRYSKVLDAAGNPLSVREALALINQTLDEVLAEQEGDFDADTRWALAWFEHAGLDAGEYGVAEQLSKSKNTSVKGMEDSGILVSSRGKVRLLKPSELRVEWDPATDTRITVWETVHQLIRSLEAGGERAAAELASKLGSKAEVARELAYRLYTLCERKKRAQEALSYNGLVQSWPEIVRLAREAGKPTVVQAALFQGTQE